MLLYQRNDLIRVPALHATADSERQTLRQFGLRQPVLTLPPGIRLPAQLRPRAEPRAVRRALFLGRIHPQKGIMNLLEAWAALRAKDWQLDIAGPEERGHGERVRREVNRLGLEGTVTFHGPVFDTRKDELLHHASLLLAPSLSENFGIVIAEGLAHGLPVITTTGTPWQVLQREKCGWWVPFGVEPLAQALRAALALPPEELAEMGRRGRALAERDFAWPRIASRMAETYAWLLGSGPKPDCVDEKS